MGFRIKSTTETIGSVGGMVLVGQIAKGCGLHKVIEATTLFHDVLLSLYGLIVQGRTTFEEINLFQNDPLFKKALGIGKVLNSELKTDMHVERLPSGKRAVNSLILTVAMRAFNTLRFIGQKALAAKGLLPVKTEVKRKRLRKVIDDLIRIGRINTFLPRM